MPSELLHLYLVVHLVTIVASCIQRNVTRQHFVRPSSPICCKGSQASTLPQLPLHKPAVKRNSRYPYCHKICDTNATCVTRNHTHGTCLLTSIRWKPSAESSNCVIAADTASGAAVRANKFSNLIIYLTAIRKATRPAYLAQKRAGTVSMS